VSGRAQKRFKENYAACFVRPDCSSGKKSATFTKTLANKIAIVAHNWNIPNGLGAEFGWCHVEVISPNFESPSETYGMECSGIGPKSLQMAN